MRAPYRRMGDQIAAASEQVQPLDLRSWSGSECRRRDQHMARVLGQRVHQVGGTQRFTLEVTLDVVADQFLAGTAVSVDRKQLAGRQRLIERPELFRQTDHHTPVDRKSNRLNSSNYCAS